MVDPPNPFGLFFTSPAKQLLGKMGQEDFFLLEPNHIWSRRKLGEKLWRLRNGVRTDAPRTLAPGIFAPGLIHR